MEFDLVVRNGLVVDGSGTPGIVGDVAVIGGRIAAVGDVGERGREEIDADGHVVAPGFVDAHTHMDAQVFWDPLGESSCWHGVTTAVMGNCGYTLAPVRPGQRDLVARNIQRAEDIPAEALETGVPWTWSTFPELLDVLDALPKGINVAQPIGHSALRIWAMGARAFDDIASEDDLAVMREELTDALRAGAAGFTSSRNSTHVAADGRPVASRLAAWEEVAALVRVMGRVGVGCYEDSGGEHGVDYAENLGRLEVLGRETGVPILVAAPMLPMMRAIEHAVASGAEIWGLTHSRGFGVLQSFRTRVSFDALDGEWRSVRSRPLDEQQRLFRQPDVRERLVAEARQGVYPSPAAGGPFAPDYEQIYVMRSAYLPNPSVADEARRRRVDPVEAMIDIALEHDFDAFFAQVFPGTFFAGQSTDGRDAEFAELFRHPNAAMTFSDAGAHTSFIADASIQTHLLAYWVRERQALTIEDAIRAVTHQPARAWRLHDRGLLTPGYAADITIFDPDVVAPLVPRVVEDLPTGAPRLEQRAAGYLATIVNGQVFTRAGEGDRRPSRSPPPIAPRGRRMTPEEFTMPTPQPTSAPIEETLDRIRVHDVDTHISEPADVWTRRMPSKWGDAVPHTRPDPETGLSFWYIDGQKVTTFGDAALTPYDDETAAGAFEPTARLAWMDRNGIFSQVLYPNMLGFFPRAFMRDPVFGIDCVRAYNDFQTEFAATDRARLVPAAYLPWWDVDASLAELERCAALGHTAINFAWEFEKVGLPPLRDAHWNPLLASVEERGMVINFHVGFNTENLDVAAVMAQAPIDRVATSAKFFLGNVECIAELIMGRICHRFPTLRFVSVESGIGFIPYLIEALEWQFLNANLHREHPDMLLPSEYFRRQIYGTFWFEGDIAALAHTYPDNFMFETDYPHASSLTPADSLPCVTGPRETIVSHLADLPEELVVKLLHDNAASVYQLS